MIFRVSKDKENPYVMLDKRFFHDSTISYKAKGILGYLLSKPDDWKVREKDIVNHGTDGRDSVRAALQELIKARYIVREQAREGGKFAENMYIVSETPLPDTNPPQTGFPSPVNPSPGNPTLTNNDLLLKNDLTNMGDEEKTENQKPEHPTPKPTPPQSAIQKLIQTRIVASAKNPPRLGRAPPFDKRVLEVWRENKLPQWIDHKGLTKRDKGQLKEMVDYFGGEDAALDALRDALLQARSNPFYQGKSFSMANILSNSKGIEYAEKYRTSATVARKGPSNSGQASSPADIPPPPLDGSAQPLSGLAGHYMGEPTRVKGYYRDFAGSTRYYIEGREEAVYDFEIEPLYPVVFPPNEQDV